MFLSQSNIQSFKYNHVTWFLMPSSPLRSVVLSWKTMNWKILPFVPTAWTVTGCSNRGCGRVCQGHTVNRGERKALVITDRPESHSLTCDETLPHTACAHRPEHFQKWTWASWIETDLAGAYSEHQLFPGSIACGREGRDSLPWNLTTHSSQS